MSSADIIVLGAGPAGLDAARLLAAEGHSVTVLEREERVGGLAASFTVAGVRVDHGSHRLHGAADPAILSDLRALLGDELQTRRRHGRIRLGDRWLRFPLRATDALTSLPPSFVVRAAASAAASMVRRRDDTTFESFVRTGLGSFMGRAFYFPYARKIWGLDPSEISGEQARRRIGAATPGQILRRLTRRADGPPTFLYPAGGFGRISEVLADAAAEQGADIRTGTAATAVDAGPDGVRVKTDGEELSASALWSTIPIVALDRLLHPDSEPPDLSFRSLLLVYLVLDRPRFSPFDAHYLPAGGVPVTRVSEPKNYRDGPDPADRTVLCVEIPCDRGDPTWSMPDEDAGALAVESMARAGFDPTPVSGVVVRRVPAAYPVYRVGFKEELDRVHDRVESHHRVLTFGRQGLFAHDNTHHTLAMAREAAAAITPGGLVDRAAWARALQRFRSHVVED